MDRGAWWATVYGVAKELDTAQQLNDKVCDTILKEKKVSIDKGEGKLQTN